MEFYELHPEYPQFRYINTAVNVLREGGVIIYPTDTVYEIGCDIFNKVALQRVKDIKIDPDIKLLSFICSCFTDISKYANISWRFSTEHWREPASLLSRYPII